MIGRTVAAGAVIELARRRTREIKQLPEVLRRQRRVDHQHLRYQRGEGNGREVFDGVVGQFGIYGGIDGIGTEIGHQQRASVRRLLGDVFERENAVGAGTIVDDYRLVP